MSDKASAAYHPWHSAEEMAAALSMSADAPRAETPTTEQSAQNGSSFGAGEMFPDGPVPCVCIACGASLGMESRVGGLQWKFRQHVDSGGCPKGGRR